MRILTFHLSIVSRRYNMRTYRVKKIVWDLNPTNTFTQRDHQKRTTTHGDHAGAAAAAEQHERGTRMCYALCAV